VPLQAIALEAIERQLSTRHGRLLFPAERGGYLDLHNFRNRTGSRHNVPPGSSLCAGSTISGTPSRPSRSVPAFPPSICPVTWASLTMIDRHYGHLARDGREHAIRLLDELSAGQWPRWTLVDAAWTPMPARAASRDNGNIS